MTESTTTYTFLALPDDELLAKAEKALGAGQLRHDYLSIIDDAGCRYRGHHELTPIQRLKIARILAGHEPGCAVVGVHPELQQPTSQENTDV